MNYRDFQIVQKILFEIGIIEELIDGFDLEKFIEDEKIKRAVCMTLINIGEFVKNLTEDFKSKYSSLPWRGIAGMRDITAHKYQTLKMGDVWFTVEKDIPQLKKQLNKIMKDVKC